MRVLAICFTLAAAALAGCATPPQNESGAAPEPTVTAPPQPRAEAQPPSTQAPAAEPAKIAANDDEVICRNEKLLGTRIAKRVCKIRAQLRLEEESARRMMQNRDKKSHGVVDASTTGT